MHPMRVLWGRRGVLPLAPTVFRFNRSDVHLCDDVEMNCSCIVQAGCRSRQARLLSFLLSVRLFLLSTNLMLNRDKEKKRCELSVSLLCIYLYMYIIFSRCGCTFSNQSMHTHTRAHTQHKVTNMIIRRAHSMCQNYHIYFVWSRLYLL